MISMRVRAEAAVSSSGWIWHIGLVGAVLTGFLYLHGDRAEAEAFGEATAFIFALGALWSFWSPR